MSHIGKDPIRVRQRSSLPVFVLACLSAALLAACTPAGSTTAGSDSSATIDPTAKTGPPPDPNTTRMEPRVAMRFREARRAVLRDALSAQAWGVYGEVCDAHFLLDEAGACYRRAMELSPDEFRWRYLHAYLRQRQSADDSEVIAEYQEAANLDSNYPALMFRLGFMLSRAGRLTEAKEAYLTAIELDGRFAQAHRAVGQVFLSLEDPTAALRHLKRASDLMPTDGATYTALTQAYMRLGQTDRAKQALEKSRGLGRKHAIPDPIRQEVQARAAGGNACLARARRLVQIGDHAGAIEEFTRALEAFPDDPVVHYELGTACVQAGRPKNAQAQFAEALRLKDDLVKARVSLGLLLASQNKLDQAVEQFRQALTQTPDDAILRVKLAMALVKSGRFDDAIEHCQRAAELAPSMAGIQVLWGMALMGRAQPGQAAIRFREALRLDPQDARARRMLGTAVRQLRSGNPRIEPDTTSPEPP